MPAVIEPTNYTKLSKKIIHQADDLANGFQTNLHTSQDRNKFSGHHHKLHKSSHHEYIRV
jgi:hypothetical protein